MTRARTVRLGSAIGFAALVLAFGLALVATPRAALAQTSRAEGAENSHEKAAEEESPGTINWFDFTNREQPPYAALLVNFALLAGAYYYFGKKPVAEALAKHRASVAKDIEEAQRMKREAEQRAESYQAKLKDLETELARARLALEESGKGDRDRIVTEAREKAERMQKDAAFLLEQEAMQMRLDLQREAVLAALAAAEELLKTRVNQGDQERLAEEFLAKLEETAPTGASRAWGQP